MSETTACYRRLGQIFVLVLVVAGLHGSTAKGGTVRHDRADSLYLSLAQDSRYQSVGQVSLLANDGYNYLASAVVIDSKWVLTAGHVVADAVSMNFNIAGNTYAAARWIAHPNYLNGDSSYDSN